MKFNKYFLINLISGLTVGLIVGVAVFAFTNPTGNPTVGGGALYYSGGNVGIGTTNPSNLLSLKPATNVAPLRLEQNNTTDAWTMLADSSDGKLTFSRVGAGAVANALNIAITTGNVGIGTTGPGYKLDVQGGQINASGGLCIAGVCQTSWSGVSGVTGSGTANYVSKWTAGSTLGNSLIYDNGTNVGIGTTNPSNLLSLKPATNVAPLRLEQNNTTDAWTMLADSSDGKLTFSRVGAGAVANALNIAITTGNVGIGTTGPNTKLQIYGDSGNLLKLQSSTGMGTAGQAMGMTFVQSGDVEVSRIESITEANTKIGLRFYTYNGSVGERVRIDNQGNVGIGTTAPNAALDVRSVISIGATPATSGALSGSIRVPQNFSVVGRNNANTANVVALGYGRELADVISIGASDNPAGTVTNVYGPMKVFGAWVAMANNTVYQAATDGFVVGWVSGSEAYYSYGVTDASNPPTTERFRISVGGGGGPTNFSAFFMPVRKNDYWKVYLVTTGTVYWIPLGL